MEKLMSWETTVYSVYGYESSVVACRMLGFSGYWRELSSGCYPLGNGYRMYNTRLMRFHSPDELSPFLEGGINAYMYCGGDPVNNKDESGRAGGTGLTALLKQHGLSKKHLKPFFKMLKLENDSWTFYQVKDTGTHKFRGAKTATGFSVAAQPAPPELPSGGYLNRENLYIPWARGKEHRTVTNLTKFKYIEVRSSQPYVSLDGPRRTLAPDNDYSTVSNVAGRVRAGDRDGDD
ncbi:RHS repeat-associated core domain-containing protein [Pseudomonas farsensis]|uniref:RHS repeat-associated core domain-containing protein n=1 Tax=Pseudomonas farsensis TaxID=2745492 RepID=UPI003BB5FC7C